MTSDPALCARTQEIVDTVALKSQTDIALRAGQSKLRLVSNRLLELAEILRLARRFVKV